MPENHPEGGADAQEADRVQERDIEQGLRFLHTLSMQSKMDLVALNSRVLALIEQLVAAGTLDLRAFDERRKLVAEREAKRMTDEGHVRVLVDETPDKYALAELPEIDCHTRLHLCQARCCTLSLGLSFQDLEERVVQWDYGRPYHIRQREDGYCAHNDCNTRTCQVYHHRPAVCRTYDCRNDPRIWKDFANRIPADPPAPAGTPAAAP